jgi:hypothetical protein
MCCHQSFDWLSVVFIPAAISVIVGGGVGFFASLYASRMLLYQQTLATAASCTLELKMLTTTGKFDDAVVGCSSTHVRIRGCNLALLLQGHLEAAQDLLQICGESERATGEILMGERPHFQGVHSDEQQMQRIEKSLVMLSSTIGARITRIKTPFWRFFDWRQRSPTIGLNKKASPG